MQAQHTNEDWRNVLELVEDLAATPNTHYVKQWAIREHIREIACNRLGIGYHEFPCLHKTR